ncbi:MAG TPA: DNA-processing protein DprA [Thermoleophilia bacterium]|nr:DNA-processing protein DprA [Thermoleophilia bacterium]
MGGSSAEDVAAFEAALGLAWLGQYGCSPLLQLLARESAETIWTASRETLQKWGLAPSVVARFHGKRETFSAAAIRGQMDSSGLAFVPFGSPWFPKELAELKYPPAGLFVKGPPDRMECLLRVPRVTLVGTRRASPYGKRVADLLATAFVGRGVAVISGLALGIDGRAHQAALDARGTTAAILGCGADIAYPPRHRCLYERVTREGVIISELPPGALPARWTFPHRNRLLAALGDAVVVVEGSRQSGALQTAEAALELGRPVFAVPGLITSENHQGCNWLIFDGAAPAVDPSVTVEEFLLRTRIEMGDRSPVVGEAANPRPEKLTGAGSPLHTPVMEALAVGACTVDDLVARSGMDARRVTVALAELEVHGLVFRSGGGLYIRAP